MDGVPKKWIIGNFRKSSGKHRAYLFRPAEFSVGIGFKMIYSIIAFEKTRGYQKIFIFEKVADQNVTLANRKILDFRRFSITGPLKRVPRSMTIRIEIIQLKITLTFLILAYICPNFVGIQVSDQILWICWQNVDMSTKMLTSTSELAKSHYNDLWSSECSEASDVNKNVDMSTFLPNTIHENIQDESGASIVIAKPT